MNAVTSSYAIIFLPRLISGDTRHIHLLKPRLVLLLSKVIAATGNNFYFSILLVEEYTFLDHIAQELSVQNKMWSVCSVLADFKDERMSNGRSKYLREVTKQGC